MFEKRMIGESGDRSEITELKKKAIKMNFVQKKGLPKKSIIKIWKKYLIAGLIILSFFLAYRGTVKIYNVISNWSPMDIIWGLGTALDISNAKTNFLLLGVGGTGHEGPSLTDTVMIASLDHKNRTLGLLSIPRDLFVDVPGYRAKQRVNSIFALGMLKRNNEKDGFVLLRSALEQVLDLPIHYHVRVDFRGFVDLVDELDGIDVYVDTSFVDEKYPGAKFTWKTVSFDSGANHFFGNEALEFARSRHSQSIEGSDFARARRQQKVINAVKDRLEQKGVLSSPSMIKNFYMIIRKYTDTDMGLSEILSLGKIASEFQSESVHSHVMTDGFDGFLYAPDTSGDKFYSGLFMLLPLGNNYKRIQKFVDLIFNHSDIYTFEKARIRVLNGTGKTMSASTCAQYLMRYGFKVVKISNSSTGDVFDNTTIYDHSLNKFPETKSELSTLVNAIEVDVNYENTATDADLTITLGKDEKCTDL